jgi:hypothetical protein
MGLFSPYYFEFVFPLTSTSSAIYTLSPPKKNIGRFLKFKT